MNATGVVYYLFTMKVNVIMGVSKHVNSSFMQLVSHFLFFSLCLCGLTFLIIIKVEVKDTTST